MYNVGTGKKNYRDLTQLKKTIKLKKIIES